MGDLYLMNSTEGTFNKYVKEEGKKGVHEKNLGERGCQDLPVT